MSESPVGNFLKNNIWGILFFSLVTGVIGNYIYDTLKNKGLIGEKEEPLTNKIDKLTTSKNSTSAVDDIFRTTDLNGIKISKYKISQIIKLDSAISGMNGALILLIDKKVTGLQGEFKYYPYNGRVLVFEPTPFDVDTYEETAKDDIKQAILMVVDENLNLIYQEQLGREMARLDRVYLYKDLKIPTFVITTEFSIGMGSYNGPVSCLFEVNQAKINYLFNKTGFMTSLKRAWYIVPNGEDKQIFVKSTNPTTELSKNFTDERSEKDFMITYEKYVFSNGKWITERYEEYGFWENESINNFNLDEFETKFQK